MRLVLRCCHSIIDPHVTVAPAAPSIELPITSTDFAQRPQTIRIACPIFGCQFRRLLGGVKYGFDSASALAGAASIATNKPVRANDMYIMALILPDGRISSRPTMIPPIYDIQER